MLAKFSINEENMTARTILVQQNIDRAEIT